MKTALDDHGAICNAAALGVDDVVHKRVRCPGCQLKIFEMWPEGWDAHASSACAGLSEGSAEQRKDEFKAKFRHLFR